MVKQRHDPGRPMTLTLGADRCRRKRLDTMKTLVAVTIVFMAGTAVNAQDPIVLKMGRLSQDGSFAVQVVAVENHTSIFLKLVQVECGFYQGDQLMASGVKSLENIKAGDTGFTEVQGRNAAGATSTKCRLVLAE
jgi:hypothetical protein